MARGAAPKMAKGVEVVIVDDDSVHAPLHPRTLFAQALESARIPAPVVDVPTAGQESPVYVALFGELRGERHEVAYRSETLEKVSWICETATLHRRDAVIVLFAPPVLARQIRGSAPIVCAWSGDRCMQEAVARWLMRS